MIQTAKDFSIQKAKEKNQLIEKLENRIILLDQKLLIISDEVLKDSVIRKIKQTEHFLLDIHQERVTAARFRSKAQYYLQGEKCSKYFFNLEKSRGNAKIINQLITDQGAIIKDHKDILNEEARFFQRLFAQPHTELWTYHNSTDVFLTDDEKEFFEHELSINELSSALMSMANDKTPGCDGLTAEFYKVFWIHIQNLFLRLVRFLFE